MPVKQSVLQITERLLWVSNTHIAFRQNENFSFLDLITTAI